VYSIRIRCGGCDNKIDLTLQTVAHVLPDDGMLEDMRELARPEVICTSEKEDTRASGFGLCPLCGAASLVTFETSLQNYRNIRKYQNESDPFPGRPIWNIRNFPEPKRVEADPRWPEDVRTKYEDAKESAVTKRSPGGIALLARTCLEAALKGRGARGETLKDKIAFVAECAQITPEMKSWADRLRAYGNKGAHEGTTFSRDEAEECIAFLELFLKLFLSLPADIRERAAGTGQTDKTKQPD